MAFMDKLKSMFTGGSADAHAGHDHSHDHSDDHSHEPAAPPLPPADPALIGDPATSEEDENRPA